MPPVFKGIDDKGNPIGTNVTFWKAVKAGAKAPSVAPKFEALGLEECSGKYNVVTCIDVMIHYPQEKMAQMVQGLANRADKRLIISFAQDTWHRSRSHVPGGGAQAAAQAVVVARGQAG